MHVFKAEIKIIGANPYVSVPEKILNAVFMQAGRSSGPVPVCGLVNSKPYRQTLMKYSGEWRLYVNTTMLKNSPKRIGEIIEVAVEHDPADRSIQPHPKFTKALSDNKEARAAFDSLRPSRQKEIVRYIANLKMEESIERNIARAIDFLSGKGRFAGRDKV